MQNIDIDLFEVPIHFAGFPRASLHLRKICVCPFISNGRRNLKLLNRQ